MKIKLFSAKWCTKCQPLKQLLTESDFGLDVEHFDVDSYPELCIESQVRSVPTIILEKDGVEIKRTTGNKTLAQLQEFVSV